MKMCQKHWDQLRAAIDARGLTSLVGTAEEAVKQLQGGAPRDPLLTAHNAIALTALEMGGPYLLTGDYCPVCEAIKGLSGQASPSGVVSTDDEMEALWIDGAADAALGACKELGLVPEH